MSDRSQDVTSYSGRWVARIRGKIIAQGGTPDQATLAANKSRHKEKVEISYVPLPLDQPPLLDTIHTTFPNQELYLVGGAVRDMLLGRPSRDLDFALPSKAISLARRVANSLDADFMILDETRDTGRVIATDENRLRTFLDFASYRGSSLEDDLRDRDFTINAIAYDVHARTLIDPMNGMRDLRTKLIRACSSSSVENDPVRILRAVRQAAEFDFKIDLETRQLMTEAVSHLPKISPERQRDELFKILDGPRAGAAIQALELLGVFPYVLPELSPLKGTEQSPPHVFDVWEHTLKVLGFLEGILSALELQSTGRDKFLNMMVDRLGKYQGHIRSHFSRTLNTDRTLRSVLFFAALYHDVEKPAARSTDKEGRFRFLEHEVKGAQTASQRGRDLNLSNDEIERIGMIVLNHMRFHFLTREQMEKKQEPSRRAVYRFFRASGEAGIDLILLGLADFRGIHDDALTKDHWIAALQVSEILLENYYNKRPVAVSPPRLVDGNDLMREFHLEPGKMIGHALEAIREAQATGQVSTRDEAILFAGEWFTKSQDKENENRGSQ